MLNKPIKIMYGNNLKKLIDKVQEKHKNILILGRNNFDIKNEEHLCLLRIASIYQQFMKGNIYIRCGLFNFLKLKKRYKSKINIVWHRKSFGDSCDNIISIIEDVTRPGIFKEVFHEYYNN